MHTIEISDAAFRILMQHKADGRFELSTIDEMDELFCFADRSWTVPEFVQDDLATIRARVAKRSNLNPDVFLP